MGQIFDTSCARGVFDRASARSTENMKGRKEGGSCWKSEVSEACHIEFTKIIIRSLSLMMSVFVKV